MTKEKLLEEIKQDIIELINYHAENVAAMERDNQKDTISRAYFKGKQNAYTTALNIITNIFNSAETDL